MDEKATNTAVTIPTAEAIAKDPAPRTAETINAIPEIPSSTVRETPRRVVTPARLFQYRGQNGKSPKKEEETERQKISHGSSRADDDTGFTSRPYYDQA